ncbi:nucleotide disphospho-sugar-binding domain-containing protein [Thermostaphylospora chromogena]|nr:nucleotide disphospho-sugar-binding domain-containing protein [Thermostaphylospora chromogena]
MRVMVTGFPQPTHFYPLVPYAQALQNAGHEVCVACPGGVEDLITAAGLTAVTTGKAQEVSVDTWAAMEAPDLNEMDRYADGLGFHDPADRDHWEVFYQYFLFAVRFYIPRTPRKDIEELVDFARVWKPDLVLWESWFPAGAVVARACGAAHARVVIGPDYGMWTAEQFAARRSRAEALSLENPYPPTVARLADHYGIEVDDELLNGQRTIDPLMPELRLVDGASDIPVRWIPYNGGMPKPAWLYGRPERPRVAFTVGVSTRAFDRGEWRTPKVFEAVADLDVEVVATLNSDQLVGIDKIPDNVRTVDYVPLTQLLPTCSAVISHGSSGTLWSSVAANLPQIIADTDQHHRLDLEDAEQKTTAARAAAGDTEDRVTERAPDSWLSSKFIVDRGAGLRLDHRTQSVEEIRELITKVLEDPAYREGAAALYEDWRSRPSPADIVPELEKLAAER